MFNFIHIFGYNYCMKIDLSYIESLLNKWGKNPIKGPKFILNNQKPYYLNQRKEIYINCICPELNYLKKSVFLSHIRKGSNPFYYEHFDLIIKKKIDAYGRKSNPSFFCKNPNYKKQSPRKVLISSTDGKIEKIIRWGHLKEKMDYELNPLKTEGFKRISKIKSLDQRRIDDIKYINKLGKKAKIPYICIDPFYKKSKKGDYQALVECIETKEKKLVYKYNIKANSEVFDLGIAYYSKLATLLEKKIKQNYNLECKVLNAKVKPCSDNKNTLKSNSLALVLNLTTGELKNLVIYKIINKKYSSDPFEMTQNKVELPKIHPLYKKMLNRLNIKHTYNYRLGKGAIADFKIQIPNSNKHIILEVKQSSKFYSHNNQFNRYKQKLGLKQHNCIGMILSDPVGSHKKSVSLKSLAKLLSKLKKQNNRVDINQYLY